MRARNLEKALDTPAHIYYKYEGVSPAGSHKPNTAVARHQRGLAVRGKRRAKVIAFNLSGHGHLDMAAYDDYFSGRLQDFEYPEAEVRKSMANLPKVAL